MNDYYERVFVPRDKSKTIGPDAADVTVIFNGAFVSVITDSYEGHAIMSLELARLVLPALQRAVDHASRSQGDINHVAFPALEGPPPMTEPTPARRTLAEFRAMRFMEIDGRQLAAGYNVLSPDGHHLTHHDFVVLEKLPAGSYLVEQPPATAAVPVPGPRAGG